MKKILSLTISMLILISNTITLSAAVIEENELQESFSYHITFERIIEDPNYMEACLDAYCSGGQTGQGHALAAVSYDHVMLDSDNDTGSFVTVWARAGDYQNESNILYPDPSKMNATYSVVEYRLTDAMNLGNEAQ